MNTTEKLEQALQHARETYEANGRKDYEAGVVEGLKRALEIVKAAEGKGRQ